MIYSIQKLVEYPCIVGFRKKKPEHKLVYNINLLYKKINWAAGLSEDLWACHTAEVAGYTVEGHVPARELTRLLQERPAALGIATPGMPAGSPGMEYGNERGAFDVVLVGLDRSQQVYASYPGN